VRILTRYIFREVISHAFLGLVLFTFIIFMRDLGRLLELIVRNSAPLPSVAEIFFLTLPTTFTVTLPMGVLVGILIGLSRLAADSEVTAMRASGFGVGLFLRAVSLFAIGVWGLAMLNSIYIAPKSAAALVALQNRLKSSQASFEIQPRVFYEEFKNTVLYVQDAIPEGDRSLWRGVFLADTTDPASPRVTVADRGVLLNDSPDNLRFHLEDGSQQQLEVKGKDQYSITTFESTDIPIAVPASSERVSDLLPVAQLSLRELLDNSRREHQAAADLVISGTPEARDLAIKASAYDELKARYYEIEFHRRFGLPAACLVLAMVGIPLGLAARKGGKSTGFVLTIALVFIYYVFSLLGVSLARQGRVSPWFGVWGGNLIFFFCGLVLLWRSDRMPGEVGNLGTFWAWVVRKWRSLGAIRSNRWQQVDFANRRQGKKRFSARFPLILDDMILRDFVMYLAMILATLLILALVFTFFELFTDIVRNKVSVLLLVEYLLNLSPSLIYQMTPVAVMLAVLITFGLMQKSSKLTAMKATGISLYRATLPVIVLSGMFAGGLFLFDQLYIPHTNKRQEILRNEIKGKPAQTYLQANRQWIVGGNDEIYYYQLFDADTDTFRGISIFEFDPRTFQLTRRISAAQAHWEPGLNKFVFEDGWVRTLKGSSIQDYTTFEVATFNELREDPNYFKKEVRQSAEMDYRELRNYIEDLQQSGFDTVKLRVQLGKKMSYPLITLVMAVLAIPFAVSGRTGGALAGVAIAISIAVIYIGTAGLFEAMGNANQLPAMLAAWSPDLVFALAAGYMLLRVPT
jgi:LPS export ABC transporter permease LptF/LPS export ABC transporter permease LptG